MVSKWLGGINVQLVTVSGSRRRMAKKNRSVFRLYPTGLFLNNRILHFARYGGKRLCAGAHGGLRRIFGLNYLLRFEILPDLSRVVP